MNKEKENTTKRVGQTPPALLQTLLRTDVGSVPHIHSLACQKESPSQFYCKTCYRGYTLLSATDSNKCTGGPIHHIHTNVSGLAADHQGGLQLRCCRCAYQAHFMRTEPAIARRIMQLLEQDKPDVDKRLVYLGKMIRIIVNAMSGDTRPLKLQNPSVLNLLEGGASG
jgi:hypothetical protein